MEYKPILGFDGYEIATDGTIISHKRPTPRLKKPYIDQDGYWRASLKPNDTPPGKMRHQYVHRLVLETYVGPCPDGMEALHKDGNPSNCHVSNLEWGTHQKNMRDKRLHDTDPNVNKTHCPRNHPYDGSNLYITPSGSRACRACKRINRQLRVARLGVL